MSYQKIENLKPSEIYEEHIEKFSKLAPWLKEYFAHYTNQEKIINLLSYWLYMNRVVVACYGADGVLEFSKGQSGNLIRFSYQYEFKVNVNLELKKKKRPLLFRLILLLMRKAYLPGGNTTSLYGKIGWRLTKLFLNCAPLQPEEERKTKLIKNISDYFSDVNFYLEGESVELFLDRFLPLVFFARQLVTFPRKEIVVDCSSSVFMEFCGYENILLCSCPLKILGRQHGGGYDTFKEDYFLSFERTLCDKFLGWGLSLENEHQLRYPLVKSETNKPSIRKIIWVERARLTLVSYVMLPDIFKQWTNLRVVNYIGQELKNSGLSFFNLIYPGHLRSNDYDGLREQELTGKKGKGETLLTSNDIVIFDNTSASLIHHCIENTIPYVFVVERDQLLSFSNLKAKWFEILRAERLVFFTDETGSLQNRLLEMQSDTFKLSEGLIKYHREHFIDI